MPLCFLSSPSGHTHYTERTLDDAEAVTLAPVSHRQLQPLRDYLWGCKSLLGGASEGGKALWRTRGEEGSGGEQRGGEVTTGTTVFALRGLFPFLEKRESEDFEKIISVWRLTEGEDLDEGMEDSF